MAQLVKRLASYLVSNPYLAITDNYKNQIRIYKRDITSLDELYKNICELYETEHMQIFGPANIRLFTYKYQRLTSLEHIMAESSIKIIIIPLLCMNH
jgi:hypothetical protein